MKLIAEYDTRTFNMGFIASFWDDRFEAMFELMAMKWVNFGVRYKLVLKSRSDRERDLNTDGCGEKVLK